jgi:hypothetical protein
LAGQKIRGKEITMAGTSGLKKENEDLSEALAG